MMTKVNAKKKSRRQTVNGKIFPISDVAITDVPLTEAVVLRRHYNYPGAAPIVMTNVPHLIVLYSPTGYSFGFGGQGPSDLAFNLCEWYLLHIGYQGQRRKERFWANPHKSEYFQLSFDLHQKFLHDFIEKVPDEGTTIPFADLKEWFDKHL